MKVFANLRRDVSFLLLALVLAGAIALALFSVGTAMKSQEATSGAATHATIKTVPMRVYRLARAHYRLQLQPAHQTVSYASLACSFQYLASWLVWMISFHMDMHLRFQLE